MIHIIEGQFGSGKSSTAVYFIKKNRGLKKLSFGNIPISPLVENYTFFDKTSDLIKILNTINKINIKEKKLYSYINTKTKTKQYKRAKFTRFFLFIDEIAILYDNNTKKINPELKTYLNQVRKLNLTIYIISPDGSQIHKDFRRHVDNYIYIKPFILEDIKTVRIKQKNDDGTPKEEIYLSRDEKGDYITKRKPIDYFLDWYYAPLVWSWYDNRYINKQNCNKDLFINDKLKLYYKQITNENTNTFFSRVKNLFY